MHIAKTLAETGQAFDSTGARRSAKIAGLVKSFGKAHGFAKSVNDRELTVAKLANNHVKTVGAQVDGGENFRRCSLAGLDVAGPVLQITSSGS
jgi:hypothetical protein